MGTLAADSVREVPTDPVEFVPRCLPPEIQRRARALLLLAPQKAARLHEKIARREELKNQFQRKLDDSRRDSRLVNHSKTRKAEQRCRIGELRMVKQVEKFGAKLQIPALAVPQRCCLDERKIKVQLTGP